MLGRRWLVRGVGALLLIASGGAGFLWWGSRQPPAFYRAAERTIASPVVRRQATRHFEQQTQRLVDEIRQAEEWAEEFSEAEINAWLAEEFPREFADIVPPEVSDPRLHIEPDGLRLGFKLDLPDQWSGIVSLRVRASVAEPNHLEIRIDSIQAGLIPVPVTDILKEVVAEASRRGLQIDWQDDEEGGVAHVTLISKGEGDPRLDAIEFSEGHLRVKGSSRPRTGSFRFEPVRITSRSTTLR